ncbi:MAG: hypothetical protein AAFV98_01635 [Chloroflexota bacterium]
MSQSNWLTQQETVQRQQEMMDHAKDARLAQVSKSAKDTRSSRNMLTKLREDLLARTLKNSENDMPVER